MTTEPKAEGGCTDVEVLRDILGDHPLPPRQREAVESAIRSLNAKAEGGEAVGWVFQHDETGRMTFCPNDGVNTPEVFAELNPGYTLCSAAYDAPPTPSPSAVEALARAAMKVAALYWPSMPVDKFDATAALKEALAHPEIAALLKGEKA